jgi:hypothetical protein
MPLLPLWALAACYRVTFTLTFFTLDKIFAATYSGPSSYDRLDIRTTWVTTKNFSFGLATKVLSYDPHASQGHLSYDLHGVRKLQSEPRYACLWT